MFGSKIIVGLLVLLAVACFAAAENFDTAYQIAANTPDTLTYSLEEGESLALTFNSNQQIDVTLSNSTLTPPNPPAGYELLYKFTLTQSATPTQETIQFVYTYDDMTEELYDIEATMFVFVPSVQNPFTPTAVVNTAAKTVTVSGTQAQLFPTLKSVPFGILAKEKTIPTGSSSKPVVTSSDVAVTSSAVSVSISYFTALVALIVTVLCL